MSKPKIPQDAMDFILLLSPVAQLIRLGIKNNMKPKELVDYVEEVILEAIKRIEKYDSMEKY